MRAGILLTAVAALATGACSDAPEPMSPEVELAPAFASANAPEKAADARTYEITVENLTSGQPFTPPAAATHRGAADVFDVGEPASYGVSQIAENGNLAPLLMALEGSDDVATVLVGADGAPAPILPGGSLTFAIGAERGARFLSLVSMLICTNDGFTGLDGVKLPERVGEENVYETDGYDAGSEINTEDWDDLVPPCAPLTGVMSDSPGSGTSDPALAENGVIRHHPGIVGDDDLIAGLHGWTDPVARVTVRRLD